MGIFGPNATPNVQPVLRQAERSNPDSKKQKEQKKEEDKSRQPPRDADSVQLEGGKKLTNRPPKAQTADKHIDFSA